MLTFLAPAALFGALLLAVPIIVHIFKPRRVRQTPFSSLRWLHMSEQRLSRRIKWHQILLFLIRAAIVLLLVLALARPMFSRSGAAALAERFVVLDVSRAMGYQAKGSATPIQQGKQIAERLINGGVAGDRTAVLITGSGTRALGPLRTDANTYIPSMRAEPVQLSDTSLGSALPVIRSMLAERRTNADVDIYFITDNHQESWNQGQVSTFLKDLPVVPRVHLIDVGAGSPQNAWIASARMVESRKPLRRVIRVQVACVGDSGQERTLRLTGLAGVPDLTQNLRLDPGQPVQVNLELPANIDLTGKVAHLVLEPADALPSDDDYYLNLDSRGATHVLVVEPDSSAPDALQPAFHLRVAIDALSLDSSGATQLIPRTVSNLATTDIKTADVIFLADVPELSDINLQAIQDRVKGGAGLVVFLGPDVKADYYNTQLYNAQKPSDGLLPVAIQPTTEADPRRGGLAPLTGIKWAHPLLAPLYDPVMGDLGLTRFRTYSKLADPAAPATPGAPALGEVLATIDEKTPALIERAYGAGKVLLFNTTANDSWSDLARRKSFVPLIDRVLSHMTGGGMRRTFEAGQTVALAMPALSSQEKLTITAPSGAALKPALQTVNGRTIVRLDEANEVGVYQVHREGGSGQDFQFVVQASRGDSALMPMDQATLQGWWAPAKLQIVSASEAGQSLDTSASRTALWPLLVFLACAAFLTEMYLTHRFCPRIAPAAVVASTRRSLIAPTTPAAPGNTPGPGTPIGAAT